MHKLHAYNNIIKITFMLVKSVVILFIGSIIGFILLYASYCLPVDNMYKNAQESIPLFKFEGTYPQLIFDYYETQLDNFTDALMISNAIYNGDKTTLDKTINVYRLCVNGKNPTDSLIKILSNNSNFEYILDSYSRYWHGYLIFLKPLLIIFNYSDIRVINSIMQFFIVFIVCYLMIKFKQNYYIIPYLISITLISPISISLSLQFSAIFYIFNISLIIMLKFYEKLKENNKLIFYFLIVGMVTSYMDLLTYPIATLGMPLIMYLIITKNKDLLFYIKKVIIYSTFWGIGYGGMWVSKPLISNMLLGNGFLSNFTSAFKNRTSLTSRNTTISRFSAIWRNISVYCKIGYLLFFLIIFLAFIYKIIQNRKNITKLVILESFKYILVCIMPFLWYMFAVNHSYIHFWFSFRNLIVLFFGGLCFCIHFAYTNIAASHKTNNSYNITKNHNLF